LVHTISLSKSIAMFCEFDITRSTTHKACTLSAHKLRIQDSCTNRPLQSS
jgi:hypothetical protein